jgi:hypothetical protein
MLLIQCQWLPKLEKANPQIVPATPAATNQRNAHNSGRPLGGASSQMFVMVDPRGRRHRSFAGEGLGGLHRSSAARPTIQSGPGLLCSTLGRLYLTKNAAH